MMKRELRGDITFFLETKIYVAGGRKLYSTATRERKDPKQKGITHDRTRSNVPRIGAQSENFDPFD